MIKEPLVSIILPVYNAQRYITEAIESVLVQSYENWELIIVDDGSTDETRAIIDDFDDTRIIVHSQENAGVSVARNKGLELAKGEYITFLDADDVLSKESLTVRVAYLEEHQTVDLVDGRIHVKDAKVKTTLRIYEPYYSGELLPRLLALESRVFFNVCYMFRREISEGIVFNEKMTHVEDLLFYIQLSISKNVKYGFVDEVVYWYRSGHASTMRDLSGLEKGYIRLLKILKEDKHIASLDYLFLKLKIMKIMFLSWLNEHKVLNAINSVFKIVWLQEN